MQLKQTLPFTKFQPRESIKPEDAKNTTVVGKSRIYKTTQTNIAVIYFLCYILNKHQCLNCLIGILACNNGNKGYMYFLDVPLSDTEVFPYVFTSPKAFPTPY